MSKSEYIEHLKLKRIGYLERAEELKELIEEINNDDTEEYNAPLTKEGKPDKRFNGDNGQGQVTDPENDLRLKENEEKRNEIGRKAKK